MHAIMPSRFHYLHCTPLLHSLPFLLFITGRMDGIVECKYTPSLSTSSFSNYVLFAHTLSFFFWCCLYFHTPLITQPSLLFLYLLSRLFYSFIQHSLIHPSRLPSHHLPPLTFLFLCYCSLLHFPHPLLPILTHSPWIFLLFYPFSSLLSNVFLPTSYTFQLPSLPSYRLSSPLPLLCPILFLPLLACRTIRRSTWSTYTAGLTACAPRMKAPTSSSPPLPSI